MNIEWWNLIFGLRVGNVPRAAAMVVEEWLHFSNGPFILGTAPNQKEGSTKPLSNQKVNPLQLLQGGGRTQRISGYHISNMNYILEI